MARAKHRLEAYKMIYGKYPDYGLDGERHYQEFCNLCEDYTLDDLVKRLKSPNSNEKQNTGLINYHYEENALTEDLLVSHIKWIHEKWHISIPDVRWWNRALKKQATEMFRDFENSELHYWMHKLENDAWYKEHITDAFTFKMVRRYIENGLRQTKV